MTNHEIIAEEAMLKNYEYDGENIKTFVQWQQEGYSVKKGEKAFIKCQIWKPKNKKEVDKEEADENPYADRRMRLVTASLFTIEQVEEIKQEEAAHSPSKVCELPQ